MSCSKSLLSSVLAVGLLFAGCGQLPKPFKSELGSGAESPLVAMLDAAGIVVAPIIGAPPGVAGPLSEIMAAELRRANVPATTTSVLKNAFLLEGKTVLTPLASDKNLVTIKWTVTNVVGDVVTELVTSSSVSGIAWKTASLPSLNTVSEDVVPRIANTLQTKYPVVARKEWPLVAVVAVEGAPGDGNEMLKNAFVAVLKDAGLPVTANPENAVIQIFGKVEITDQTLKRETIEINWIFLEPNGSEIGKMTQSNSVEKGRVHSKWGSLAYDVTFAMVDSIADVLLTMDRTEGVRQGR